MTRVETPYDVAVYFRHLCDRHDLCTVRAILWAPVDAEDGVTHVQADEMAANRVIFVTANRNIYLSNANVVAVWTEGARRQFCLLWSLLRGVPVTCRWQERVVTSSAEYPDLEYGAWLAYHGGDLDLMSAPRMASLAGTVYVRRTGQFSGVLDATRAWWAGRMERFQQSDPCVRRTHLALRAVEAVGAGTVDLVRWVPRRSTMVIYVSDAGNAARGDAPMRVRLQVEPRPGVPVQVDVQSVVFLLYGLAAPLLAGRDGQCDRGLVHAMAPDSGQWVAWLYLPLALDMENVHGRNLLRMRSGGLLSLPEIDLTGIHAARVEYDAAIEEMVRMNTQGAGA